MLLSVVGDRLVDGLYGGQLLRVQSGVQVLQQGLGLRRGHRVVCQTAEPVVTLLNAPERCTITGEGGTLTPKPCSLTYRTMSRLFLVATLLAMLCALAIESCSARICSSSAEADFLSALRTMRRKEFSCSLVESTEETGSSRGHYCINATINAPLS